MEINNRQNLAFGTLHIRISENLPERVAKAAKKFLFEYKGKDEIKLSSAGCSGRLYVKVGSTPKQEKSIMLILRTLGAKVTRTVNMGADNRITERNNNWLRGFKLY